VQFTADGQLIWTATGRRFPGYPQAPGYVVGAYIFAPPICSYCAYEIRFGTRDGERRAYLTIDRGEDNPGTLADLEVVDGELITRQTKAGAPGTYTLSGRVVEMTSAGEVPVANVLIRSGRYNWYGAATDSGGSYQMSWLDVGPYSISISKNGYEPQTRPLTIDGDTRLDVVLVRR
jgi:hypothetical protein